MNRTSSNISKKYLRHFLVFAAMILVLLSSCPVKNGIKTLAGFPANKTEQGLAAKGNHSFFGNNAERCVNSETVETSVLQNASVDVNNLLPAVLFTTAFLFLFGITGKEQTHPLYGNVKIATTLPIFLRYRKILI